MKSTIGKWMEQEKKKSNPERSNPDPERQIWYVFTYMWILVVKSMTTKLQSVEAQILGREKVTRGDKQFSLGKENSYRWRKGSRTED